MQDTFSPLVSHDSDLAPHPRHEEVVNMLTHGAGLAGGAVATFAVVAHGVFQSQASTMAFGLYAVTLMAVYAASAFSHGIEQPRIKYLLRVWDQGLIYLLIAGTYTPFVVNYLQGRSQLGLLVFLWGLAGLGFASKIWGHHRINRIDVLTYIGLGWIPALALLPRVESSCFAWILAGGTAYTLGTYFLKLDRTYPYYHAVWHSLVMLGSACHFIAVVRFTAG